VKTISKIGKSIFAVYAIIIVILSCLIVLPIYLIIFNFYPKDKAPFVAHKVSRFWAKFLFTLFFIRVIIKGKELIKPEQAYVFVCNHSSQLDIPLFAMACVNAFRFLSKIEVTKIPVMGYVVKKLYITVDRSDKDDRVKSIERMKDSLLREKISVVLFPEGTRNRTNHPLIDFKDGAFRLAIDSQLPMAVLTILNTKDFIPANKFELKPGTVRAIWSEPIPTVGMTPSDLPALKEKVRNILLKNLENN
jgi:1-acyl-sn-glycerol-3-phosphate acyltransferase